MRYASITKQLHLTCFAPIPVQELRDLLSPAGAGTKHEIRHDKDGNTTVTHLSSHDVSTAEQIYELLETAAKHRSVGSTNSNNVSSRSHSIFTLSIHLSHPGTAQRRHGIINLVDLAGSERIAKSGVNDCKTGGSEKLLKETQNINKSLSSLSQVIMALKSHQAHIPYRDSKLTYVLLFSIALRELQYRTM
jgi:kinesin family protein C1